MLTLGHSPKGGGGSNPNSKFWGSFVGALFCTFTKKEGGLCQKIWGSFGGVLRERVIFFVC